MSKLYIQLGRHGDIMGLLPLLWKDAQSGEKPRLMVAAEYASLLEGVSYVEPVIYNGPHHELSKAVELAKTMSDQVVCCQVNGPVDQVKECTYKPAGQERAAASSYQKEQWKIAGRIGEWDDLLPLVFDRRDKVRETKLLRENGLIQRGKQKPLIVLALDGTSSPFPHKELLCELVTLKFGATHRIIDLPKAERIYDLLAVYEKASLLIAVDSAPLHLAWACRKLPVFALTQDKPMLWNGSSWRPNMEWYCRYSDWVSRALEMLDCIYRPNWIHPFPEKSICVWNAYEDRRMTWVRNALAVTVGMCSRDSHNVLGDTKRVPYLRDVLRMAFQRAPDDETRILLRRPKTWLENVPQDSKPIFSYRTTHDKGEKQFAPIVDLFCATKKWWKEVLPEIPDLLLGNDYWWSQCLWAIFKSHGATDATGCCYFEKEAHAL